MGRAIRIIDSYDSPIYSNEYRIALRTGSNDFQIIIEPNPKDIGDNMVGFMSQIGWTDDDSSSPNKKYLWKKFL